MGSFIRHILAPAVAFFMIVAGGSSPTHAQVYPQSPLDLSPNSVFPSRTGNKAAILPTEKEAGAARWALASTENEEIFAAYYLFDGDKLGVAEFAAARDAARRGANVYLLMDAFSVFKYLEGAVKPETIKALIEDPASGGRIHVRVFNPASPVHRLALLDPAKLFRMHDKAMYLKSRHIYFGGDRNAQNINFRLKKNLEKPHFPWQKGTNHKGLSYRSVETMVQGKAADDAREYLSDLWDASKDFDISHTEPVEVAREIQKLDLMAEAMKVLSTDPEPWLSRLKSVDAIKFVHDVVGAKGQYFNQEREFERMMDSAHDSIMLVSPYAHLPQRYLDAIDRALERRVKVTIISASLESTDSQFSSLAFGVQAKTLIAKGVKVLLHPGPDLMHSKMLNIDGRITYVGSYNFNYRSMKMDTESGMIITDRQYGEDAVVFINGIAAECRSFSPVLTPMLWCGSILSQIGSNLPFVKNQF